MIKAASSPWRSRNRRNTPLEKETERSMEKIWKSTHSPAQPKAKERKGAKRRLGGGGAPGGHLQQYRRKGGGDTVRQAHRGKTAG